MHLVLTWNLYNYTYKASIIQRQVLFVKGKSQSFNVTRINAINCKGNNYYKIYFEAGVSELLQCLVLDKKLYF